MPTTPHHIWQYNFPGVQGLGWASVLLRADGMFASVSDYGDYAYFWPGHGHDDFRKFFLRAGWHYIATKLGGPPKLDPDASFEEVRRDILKSRREQGNGPVRSARAWTRERAREAYDHVRDCGDDWEGFLRSSVTYEFFDEPWEYGSTRLDSQAVAFAQIIVCKRLRDAIAEELRAEGVAA